MTTTSKNASAHATGFPKALKSFIGYLEGTQKSAHTIKNYRLDLLAFQEFVEKRSGSSKSTPLDKLDPSDLGRFHDHLKAQGLKTNTRRRKLLTVRRFLSFLVNRNKLPEELGKKVPTPQKIERVPLTASSLELIAAIRELPTETLIDERNRALLWTLAETGCQVSEVAQLRFEDWEIGKLRIRGKAERSLPVSSELFAAIQSLRKRASGGAAAASESGKAEAEWIFRGFNKFGAVSGSISPRGVELLVRHFAPTLGVPELTPRTFRHSVVVQWFRDGCSREEIQRRLGLRTAYAFRAYEPIFKQVGEA
jgi:site-specific recombinase XerD